MKQNRWTSKVAWLTLLPVIILLGNTYGLWSVIGMTSETFGKVFMGILAILVAFGIFNDPTTKDGF
jgi:uncharacterized membrane protein